MDNLTVEAVKIKALVFKDTEENLFTVSLEGKGGPIISANTYEEACKKFIKAVSLSCALMNLTTYKDAINSSDDEMSEFVKNAKPHKPQIDFITIQ